MANQFAGFGGPAGFRGPSSRSSGSWVEESRGGPAPPIPSARSPMDYERVPHNPPAGGYGALPAGPRRPQDEPVNDCEIIAVGKPNALYVDEVERRIKDFNLKVDVMLPSANAKISSFIENLAQRGTIFAVIIRPENEAHNSVSVHVLRGVPKPEEHRNMPLQTAYNLIRKSYLDLKKKEIGPIPEKIKAIFKYMLEDRSLTDSEYAAAISFLQDRRERQAAFETRSPYESKHIDTPEELQRRILSIISGSEPILGSSKIERGGHTPF